MIFYCITFKRNIEGITEHRFFCYALNKQECIKRFCDTGHEKKDIISIHIVEELEEGGIKWES